jgi:hypothetical protein
MWTVAFFSTQIMNSEMPVMMTELQIFSSFSHSVCGCLSTTFFNFNRNLSILNLENQLHSYVCDKASSSYIPEAIVPILKPKLLFKKINCERWCPKDYLFVM